METWHRVTCCNNYQWKIESCAASGGSVPEIADTAQPEPTEAHVFYPNLFIFPTLASRAPIFFFLYIFTSTNWISATSRWLKDTLFWIAKCYNLILPFFNNQDEIHTKKTLTLTPGNIVIEAWEGVEIIRILKYFLNLRNIFRRTPTFINVVPFIKPRRLAT